MNSVQNFILYIKMKVRNNVYTAGITIAKLVIKTTKNVINVKMII